MAGVSFGSSLFPHGFPPPFPRPPPVTTQAWQMTAGRGVRLLGSRALLVRRGERGLRSQPGESADGGFGGKGGRAYYYTAALCSTYVHWMAASQPPLPIPPSPTPGSFPLCVCVSGEERGEGEVIACFCPPRPPPPSVFPPLLRCLQGPPPITTPPRLWSFPE